MSDSRPTPAISLPANGSGRRVSFIVRLWQEAGTDFWRGSVTEAQSGETLLFDNVGAMVTFLSRHSGYELEG